jgi:Holliday junction resolvase RusA-like endonuclease
MWILEGIVVIAVGLQASESFSVASVGRSRLEHTSTCQSDCTWHIPNNLYTSTQLLLPTSCYKRRLNRVIRAACKGPFGGGSCLEAAATDETCFDPANATHHLNLSTAFETLPTGRRASSSPATDTADVINSTSTAVSFSALKDERRRSEASKLDTHGFHADWINNITGSSLLWKLGFEIKGNPLPLQRHRSSRGFMYNPSAAAQEAFRKHVQLLVEENMPVTEVPSTATYPLFAPHHLLHMTLVFYLKRPKKHFVAGRPGAGRLRDGAPHALSLTRKDVDNLVKFVLDSLIGIAFADDHQVASLQVTKLLDNTDECLGKTRVIINIMKEEDLDGLIDQ